MQIGIDNRHIGQQLVIGKRIFNARLFVGNYGERRNLRTRTRRSGNCDKVSLFSHLGESVNSLSYIHETHRHIVEVYFGVFVHNPHNLRRIHCTAAAERDNDVGLERRHLFCAFDSARKRRVGSYIEENIVVNTYLVEFIGYALRKSVLIKETVRNNERLFLAHYSL